MHPDEWKRRAASRADALAGEASALSRDLFEHPELSGEESGSVARIVAVLGRHGFEVEPGLGGLPTAFRARRPEALGRALQRLGLGREVVA